MNNDDFALTNHRYNPAYRTGDVFYTISLIDPAAVDAMSELIADVLDHVRDEITDERGHSLTNHDRLRYVLYGGADEQILGSTLLAADVVTPDHIMTYIQAKMQHYGAIAEERTFSLQRMSFQYVLSRQRNGCAPTREESLDAQLRPDDAWYKANATSVVHLRDNDNMCAARSLVILRARADHTAKTLSRDEMRRLVRPDVRQAEERRYRVVYTG
jgi:hypothetical protein